MRGPLARRLGAGVIALFLLVGAAACGDDDDASSDSTETTASPADSTTTTGAAGASEAALEVADSDLGEILVDGETGLTLYAFTPDTETTSACTGGCADAWPPLAGPAEAGNGLDDALLGTITRDDGSTQATYGGHPLYQFASDSGPGDTSGQGVGEMWFVIDATGETVTGTSGATGSADETTTTAGDRYGY